MSREKQKEKGMRYIDADELWNDRPLFPSGQDAEYDAGFCDCYVAFSELIRKHIDNTTADVVPKSEVDEYKHCWQKIHDSYNEDCLEHYNKGRQDAAMEIFEEIEKILIDSAYIPDCARFVDIDKLAELKKKYTENENG